jgi:PLP dependent protein
LLSDRYAAIQERIAAACKASGRDSSEISLIVVTKNHPAELAANLMKLGVFDFGENRDQEAAPKAKQLEESSLARWHFIGQLQSNKVKSVLSYSSSLHSLDRDSLLLELEKRTLDRPEPFPVFIQVNLTDDPNRGGVNPSELASFSEKVNRAKGLSLLGLMGVASLGTDPERDFEKMASYSQRLRFDLPEAKYLSIGMSSDFEQAISYGATHLRIGSAIIGNRAG